MFHLDKSYKYNLKKGGQSFYFSTLNEEDVRFVKV